MVIEMKEIILGLILISISIYLYKINKKPFIEFGQIIKPLETTVEDIQNGYEDRPYMPFRYPNNQTMSLLKMDINYWGIIDKEYFKFMKMKRKIFNEYKIDKLKEHKFFKRFYGLEYDKVFIELSEFTINHYINRYPKLFSKKGNKIYNHLMNEEYDIREMDPFLIVTRIAMEDFYVSYKSLKDKEMKCIGVSVAFSGGGFAISPIVGKSMDSIHGPVPYYEEKLKKSMNKWFERFTDPVERESIHLVWDLDLTYSELYSKLREFENDEVKYKEYIRSIPFSEFAVRIERQSLIKLPRSGAVVFTNHPLYLNIERDLADEPGVPAILHKMLYESPAKIIRYKHYDAIRDHIAGDLLRMAAGQVARGLVGEEAAGDAAAAAAVRTIPSFPFAGWMAEASYTHARGYVKPSV